MSVSRVWFWCTRRTGAPGVVEHHQLGQRVVLVPEYLRQVELPDGPGGRRRDAERHEARHLGDVPLKLHLPHGLR